MKILYSKLRKLNVCSLYENCTNDSLNDVEKLNISLSGVGELQYQPPHNTNKETQDNTAIVVHKVQELLHLRVVCHFRPTS